MAAPTTYEWSTNLLPTKVLFYDRFESMLYIPIRDETKVKYYSTTQCLNKVIKGKTLFVYWLFCVRRRKDVSQCAVSFPIVRLCINPVIIIVKIVFVWVLLSFYYDQYHYHYCFLFGFSHCYCCDFIIIANNIILLLVVWSHAMLLNYRFVN